jgi:acetate kinase
MKILVLNCGSSSLKFQLIDMESEELLVKGNFERIGGMKTTLKLNVRGEKSEILHIARDYDEAIAFVLEILLKPEYHIINSLDEIEGVGHRIVHGGELFHESVIIDDEVIEEIEKCIALAPLHNPAGVAGIKAARKALPNIPMVAVFDTAFHQTMPAKAYIYNIPYRYYTSYKIRKYGFHGTSHRYVANRVAEVIGKPIEELKIINCHLGQGASICAIDKGNSIDTSMGLTPLSGIPMATRSGDIDPAIIPYIMKLDNLGPEDVEEILNKQSGAWGVSRSFYRL